jgi:hypothetical protein
MGRVTGQGGLLAGAVALLAAGCGGLDTPDLTRGAIAGRIVGAAPGAYAYPLGRPELKAALAADGAFELGGLPEGEYRVVLFDGELRAELAEAEVEGGMRRRLKDRYGERAQVEDGKKMRWAGLVAAAALPRGGALALSPRFEVRQTDLAVTGQGAGAVLGPLPEGDFDLAVAMDGFAPQVRTVAVPSGMSVAAEVELDVEPSAERKGCAASGGCRNGLICDPSDGFCYGCLAGTDQGCTGGSTCNPESHTCTVPSGAVGAICASCATDLECGSPMMGAYCHAEPGTAGYCTRSATVFGCPAGFREQADTQADGDPVAQGCVAVRGCHEYFEEMGEGCYGDATCQSHGVEQGVCLGARPGEGETGYCTAACDADNDCILSGWSCDLAQNLCVRN